MVNIPLTILGDEGVVSTTRTPVSRLFLGTSMASVERVDFCTIQELREKKWASDPEAIAETLLREDRTLGIVVLTRVRVHGSDPKGKMRAVFVERVITTQDCM